MKLQLIAIQFLFYAAGGLFAPTWYRLLIAQGESQFGLLLGLSAFGSIGAAYLAGWLSYKWSTTSTLAVATALQGLVILTYLQHLSLLPLYGVQIAFGVLGTAIITLQQILVAKTTKGEDKSIGMYSSWVQAGSAVAMVSSGVLLSYAGDVGVVSVTFAFLMVSSVLASSLKSV